MWYECLCVWVCFFSYENTFLCKLAFVRTTKLRDDKHQGQNFSGNGRYHNKLWYNYQNQGDVKEKLLDRGFINDTTIEYYAWTT